jgi:crotonobetainyl-CoA:carnitine CoA-transferase CaiB-like acyl-CoA transferase
MLDVGAAFLANQAMNYLLTGDVPRRTGNRHPNIQPQNVYPCASGHLALAVGNNGQFDNLARVIGRSDLAADPRFATNAARVRNLALLEPVLLDAFATRSADAWQAELDRAGVPASRINSVAEVFAEPQVRHREMVRSLPHASGALVPCVVSPLRFRNTPLEYRNAAPQLGENDRDFKA